MFDTWDFILNRIRQIGEWESGIMFSYNGEHRYYANGEWQENAPADYVYLVSPMLTLFEIYPVYHRWRTAKW